MPFPELVRLLETVTLLRGPDGCPWDRAQELPATATYLTDEAFEFQEAVRDEDLQAVADELADVLYLVVFNWLLLSERAEISFDALAGRVADKLVRRHPTIFGERDAYQGLDPNEVWTRIKEEEKDLQPPERRPASGLRDLPASTPALRQADRYGRDAAATGFDWSGPTPIIAKLQEELDELCAAMSTDDPQAMEEELGDLLFALAQLGRKLDLDAETALRQSNRKFARRFRRIESRQGHDPQRMRDLGLDGLWREWEAVKKEEGQLSGQPSSSRSPS
jgi:MazG family protein